MKHGGPSLAGGGAPHPLGPVVLFLIICVVIPVFVYFTWSRVRELCSCRRTYLMHHTLHWETVVEEGSGPSRGGVRPTKRWLLYAAVGAAVLSLVVGLYLATKE